MLYRYQKTAVTTKKNNPARSDGSRDSKVEKSKVALRRIFVFPLLLDTLPLSQCLTVGAECDQRIDTARRASGAQGKTARL